MQPIPDEILRPPVGGEEPSGRLSAVAGSGAAVRLVRDGPVPRANCPHCGGHLELSTVGARWQVHCPSDVADRLLLQLGTLEREELHVLVLNTRNVVLDQVRLYQGSVSASLVRIGELFRRAVEVNASAILLVHNHPSGEVTPSLNDVSLTTEAIRAGQLLDITVLDHLIIGSGTYVSLRDYGVTFQKRDASNPPATAGGCDQSRIGEGATEEGDSEVGGQWLAKTAHGYALDEVVSSLQKCVRRGRTDDVLFWVLELDQSGYTAYAFRRLAVIAVEDVGLADPMAVTVVNSCWELALKHRDGSRRFGSTVVAKERSAWGDEWLLMAAAYVARSAKNRELDYAAGTIVERWMKGANLLQIPDFAIDEHTRRGRAQGRGQAHFRAEGGMLHGAVVIDDDHWQARFYETVPADDGRADQ